MKQLFFKYKYTFIQRIVIVNSLVFAVFSSFPGYAAEYFIAPGGSGNGSIDAPFGTIDQALEIAQPHDIITLRAGTYNAPFYPDEGAINIPNLTIQGYPGERPHIKSEYGSGKKITLYIGLDADNVKLKNLEISGGDIYTIQTESNFDFVSADARDAAKGLTIENCEIHDSGEDIIKLSAGSDDAKIINSHIHHSCLLYTTGAASSQYPNCQGIDNVNSDRMLVQGNHIHDIPYGNPALFFKGGARDVIVERNKIEKAYSGITIGAQTDIDFYSPEDNPAPFYNSFNGVVRNNIIKNMRGDCISLMAAKDPKVYNNTLINCGSEEKGKGISFRHQPTWGDNGPMNQPTVNAFIVNNLVIATDESGTYEYQDFLIEVRGYDDNNILAVKEGSLMMNHNIYWDPRYSDLRVRNYNSFLAGPKDSFTLAEWQSSPLHNPAYADLNSFYGNPQVDGDGNLLEGSPGIGAGIPVEGLTEDYYGKTRTGAIDIGAVAY